MKSERLAMTGIHSARNTHSSGIAQTLLALLMLSAMMLATPCRARADETYSELNQRGAAAFRASDYRQAAEAWTRALDAIDPGADKAPLLNQLALVNKKLMRYDEAERYYKSAIDLIQKNPKASPRLLAIVKDNLANMYDQQDKPAEAEKMHREALALFEKSGGPNDPDVILCLNNVGQCLTAERKYDEALAIFHRIIEASEKTGESADLGTFVDNMGTVYVRMGKYAEAEPLRKRALAIYERTLGKNHLEVGTCSLNIATLYVKMDKPADGEPYMKRALQIFETTFGSDHPALVPVLREYAALLGDLNRSDEANALKKRAEAIANKTSIKKPDSGSK
jgi:tetratricopeptide (TPR) repeat protein